MTLTWPISNEPRLPMYALLSSSVTIPAKRQPFTCGGIDRAQIRLNGKHCDSRGLLSQHPNVTQSNSKHHARSMNIAQCLSPCCSHHRVRKPRILVHTSLNVAFLETSNRHLAQHVHQLRSSIKRATVHFHHTHTYAHTNVRTTFVAHRFPP